ncbi:MAG: hypothetical protein J7M25_12135 [Deltaproteobacteria bacterium]|nr:hypothetical protein [Deltaproteobacteria bacterium]
MTQVAGTTSVPRSGSNAPSRTSSDRSDGADRTGRSAAATQAGCNQSAGPSSTERRDPDTFRRLLARQSADGDAADEGGGAQDGLSEASVRRNLHRRQESHSDCHDHNRPSDAERSHESKSRSKRARRGRGPLGDLMQPRDNQVQDPNAAGIGLAGLAGLDGGPPLTHLAPVFDHAVGQVWACLPPGATPTLTGLRAGLSTGGKPSVQMELNLAHLGQVRLTIQLDPTGALNLHLQSLAGQTAGLAGLAEDLHRGLHERGIDVSDVDLSDKSWNSNSQKDSNGSNHSAGTNGSSGYDAQSDSGQPGEGDNPLAFDSPVRRLSRSARLSAARRAMPLGDLTNRGSFLA